MKLKNDMAKPAVNSQFQTHIKRFWIIYFSVIGVVIVLFTLISIGAFGFMPTFEELENPRSNLASEIYSSDQVVIGKYYIENRSNIHFEDLSPNIVNALVATEDSRFTEHSGIDVRSLFRVMFGMITGNRGAGGGSTITQQLAKNLFPRDPHQNFLKVAITKFKEWVTAVKLEHNYTKQEILAMYLNTVDFGNQSFGINSAARTYFDKTPDSLNIQESAMLIGLLKAPTRYSPVRNPENAMKRREVVLKQMEINGFISQQQYDSVRVLPIDMSRFRIQDHTVGMATYFREYLRILLTRNKPEEENYVDKKLYKEDLDLWENNPAYGWCNKNLKADGTPYNIFKDGLRIYTTINSKMQRYAEEAVNEHLGKELQKDFYKHWKGVKRAPYDWRLTDQQIDKMIMQGVYRSERYQNLKKEGIPDDKIMKIFNTPVNMRVFAWGGDKDTIMTPLDSVKYYKWFLLAGLMSVEPQTGYVRAYVGGINYKYFQYDHVCLAKRQVGSTFKPFVYTVAMQEGEFSPCAKVPNVPITFDLENGQKWEPRNSGKYKEGEMITLKEALANSVNWISAFLIKRYSPGPVVKVARKMGVKSDIPEVYAICLGTPDLSLYEMVGAINSFANEGVYIEPIFVTRIEDKYGNTLGTFVPKTQEAMSEETAYLMTSLMQGVVESGTGARLRGKYALTNQIAGKTGTTDNNSDGWFMGFVPNLTTGIWVGCEDRSIHFRSTSLGQGANMSLPIWALYMKKVYADKSLHILPADRFSKPAHELSVETDCQKYNQENRPVNFDNKNF
ncbi:MAG TPA: transglycosylase domain-containing protein [Bacteroidales bacterium]|nr:transglycosylase domain-containing protein [Bacteroidales bacterium]